MGPPDFISCQGGRHRVAVSPMQPGPGKVRWGDPCVYFRSVNLPAADDAQKLWDWARGLSCFGKVA